MIRTLLLVSAALLLGACPGQPPPDPNAPVPLGDPVPFSHHVHHVANEIACEECHPAAWTSESAGYPAIEVCITCHEGLEGGIEKASDVDRAIRQQKALVEAKKPLWGPERMERMEFHHGKHSPKVDLETKTGEVFRLGCGYCHKALSQSDAIPKEFAPPKDKCEDCHE